MWHFKSIFVLWHKYTLSDKVARHNLTKTLCRLGALQPQNISKPRGQKSHDDAGNKVDTMVVKYGSAADVFHTSSRALNNAASLFFNT